MRHLTRAIVCMLFLLAPAFAFAETHVVPDADGLYHGGVWDKAGSPYILDGYIDVAQDSNLLIRPGVSVMPASSTDYSLSALGQVTIEGSSTDPIRFYSLGTMFLGTSTISNAQFYDTSIQFTSASSTLNDDSFYGSSSGIAAKGSSIDAEGLLFSSSTYAIRSLNASPGPVLDYGYKKSDFGFHFISVAHAQTVDDPSQNHINVHDSSFEGVQYGIYNQTSNVIHAERNWWGSDAGPSASMIVGAVSYAPWTKHSVAVSCCSSVLFIPGIESSRLAQDVRSAVGTTTNRYWEPFLDSDVSNLFLDASGNSIAKGIYAPGIIDTALHLKPLYQKFIDTMNGLVSAGTIVAWQPYAYDWRLPLAKAAQGFVGTSTVVQTIESMASSSKTGKVSIVSHSNGGLVAKLVYDALRDKGEAGLVDRMVFVAVPQLGTPQALPSLLHGDNEEVAHGIVLSSDTARRLGINMPSAYSLLPDKDYFNLVPQAVIDFASSTLGGMGFSKYFPKIASYAGMKSFIDDRSHGFLSDSTNIPVTGNAGLFAQAESVHGALDDWHAASSTSLVAIAGWGIPTDVGVHYFEKVVCAAANFLHVGPKSCSPALEYSDVLDDGGDGTVAIQSALYSSSTDYVFDEGSYDKDKNASLAHGDILEADPVMSAITGALEGSSTASPYLYAGIPPHPSSQELTFGVHSPAELNIYDKQGRHTGTIPNPIAGSDLEMYETNIPGSQYREAGDQIYVTLPYSPDYSVSIDGDGIGSVEVIADVTDADSAKDIASSTFSDIPVTPMTHMELATSSGASLTDPYQAIRIDENGDGAFDATSTSGAEPSITADSYWNALGDCVKALRLKPSDEKSLLLRLGLALQNLKKGDAGRAEKAFLDLEVKRIGHLRAAKAGDKDRSNMRDLLETFLIGLGV